MQHLKATLPALGEVRIGFFDESDRLLRLLGTEELDRLARVNHLGVVASVFHGARHSRLEYVLQQCAMVELIRHYHKDDPSLALSSRYHLVGSDHSFSSMEELLKCWVLLSQFGHANYTYATERALFGFVRTDVDAQRQLLSRRLPSDLRDWAERVIGREEDRNYHYVLTAYRLLHKQKRTTLKTQFFLDTLRELVLPLSYFGVLEDEKKVRLIRLRSLFERIRLVSLVAIDSYYSHQPVRIQLINAMTGFAHVGETAESPQLAALLKRIAALLADQLYLHPTAAAVLRDYEGSNYNELRYGKQSAEYRTSRGFRALVERVLHDGFGEPSRGHCRPFVRFSFSGVDDNAGKLPRRSRALEEQLRPSTAIAVSVLQNQFSGVVHVDCFLREKATVQDVAGTVWRLYDWLREMMELRLRYTFGTSSAGQFVQRAIERQVRRGQRHIDSLYWAIVRTIVPEQLTVTHKYVDSGDSSLGPVLADIDLGSVGRYRGLSDFLQEALASDNPFQLTRDRLHELKLVHGIVRRSKAPLIMASTSQIVLRTGTNKAAKEWDGLTVEVWPDRMRLSIVEAKRGTTGRSSKGITQLAGTKRLLISKGWTSRTRRLVGGAKLILEAR